MDMTALSSSYGDSGDSLDPLPVLDESYTTHYSDTSSSYVTSTAPYMLPSIEATVAASNTDIGPPSPFHSMTKSPYVSPTIVDMEPATLFKSSAGHGHSSLTSAYTDHFMDRITAEGLEHFRSQGQQVSRASPPVSSNKLPPFPLLLYRVLEEASERGHDHVISWQVHGRGFLIHNTQEFEYNVMPKYFSSSQFSSFKRQTSWYKFGRIQSGTDKGAYYNEYFLRGRPDLAARIRRSKHGRKSAALCSKLPDPTFHRLPFCIPLLENEVNWLAGVQQSKFQSAARSRSKNEGQSNAL